MRESECFFKRIFALLWKKTKKEKTFFGNFIEKNGPLNARAAKLKTFF